MQIFCSADDSHEMSGFIFFEKMEEKKIRMMSAAVVIGDLTLNLPITTIVVGFVVCL